MAAMASGDNVKKSMGFLADYRQMNVGITRAKSSILVVGSTSTLRKDEHWNNLVASAEKRECLFGASKPYASFFSDENLELMKVRVLGKDLQQADGHGPQYDEHALYGNTGDADQGQADDNYNADGDVEMYEADD